MVSGLAVSAVVSARNEAGTIACCLRSLLGQSSAPAEVVVVDDGSRDGTLKEASRFPVRLVRVDYGNTYLAKRAGVLKASHDVVVAVDGDTVLEAGWVEKALKLLTPDVSLVTGFIQPLSGRAYERWIADFQNRSPFYLSGPSYMFRRADFLKLFGSVDQRFYEVPLGMFGGLGRVVKSPDLVAYTRLPTRDQAELFSVLRDGLTLALESL
jgi:glycosyltransferase involved in cell wall biosynthesis